MNEKDIRNAFLSLTSDTNGEKTADFVRKRLSVKSPKPNYTLRTALIILISAVILTVSVGAYEAFARKTASVDLTSDEYYFNADFSGIIDQDVVSLSKRVLNELPAYSGKGLTVYSPREVGKIFETWSEASDWLDCGILTSDMITSDCLNNLSGEIVLVSDYSNDKLTSVILHGTSWIEGEDAFCKVSIVIPQTPFVEGMGLFEGYGYAVGGKTDDAPETVIITHTTSGGDILEIPVVPPIRNDHNVRTNFDGYTAYAHFVSGGIIYSFGVCGNEADTAAEILFDVLDSLR